MKPVLPPKFIFETTMKKTKPLARSLREKRRRQAEENSKKHSLKRSSLRNLIRGGNPILNKKKRLINNPKLVL